MQIIFHVRWSLHETCTYKLKSWLFLKTILDIVDTLRFVDEILAAFREKEIPSRAPRSDYTFSITSTAIRVESAIDSCPRRSDSPDAQRNTSPELEIFRAGCIPPVGNAPEYPRVFSRLICFVALGVIERGVARSWPVCICTCRAFRSQTSFGGRLKRRGRVAISRMRRRVRVFACGRVDHAHKRTCRTHMPQRW